MKYCVKCGNQMDDRAVMCPVCHSFIAGYGEPVRPKDSGSVGWLFFGLLPFLLATVVGFILYLTWKIERPKSARMIAIGLIIKVVVFVIFMVAAYVLKSGPVPDQGSTGDWI